MFSNLVRIKLYCLQQPILRGHIRKGASRGNRITSLMWLLITFLTTCFGAPALAGFRTTGYGNLPTDGHYPNPPQIQWTGGYFEWPCKSTKALYKNSGKYNPKSIIATRGQIYRDEVFLALPRYKSGVPATLARTSLKPGTCHTTLVPFPCWQMQEEGNCRALQSVVDVVLDVNDILWVLDVGVVNTLETPIRRCPPKIVAFSVKTGKVLRTISLEGLAVKSSRLQYLVVDYETKTGQVFVYVSDAANRAIIVYNVQAGKGRRVILPKAVTTGCNNRDVLYIALTHKSCGSSLLYFTYLSSKKIFSIRTEFLRTGCAEGRVTGKFLMCKLCNILNIEGSIFL